MGTITKKMFALTNMLWVMLGLFPADFGAEVVGIVVASLKGLADELLDKAEAKIIETENKVDDKFLLPAIERVRTEFNIPDKQ